MESIKSIESIESIESMLSLNGLYRAQGLKPFSLVYIKVAQGQINWGYVSTYLK